MKALLEELAEVYLRAGRRQGEEVQVMDVDAAFPVRLGELRCDNLLQVVFLGYLATVLEHGTHRTVGVDVGVLALVVAFNGVTKGKVEHGLHDVRPALPCIRALLPVQDVCLGHGSVAKLDKTRLNKVLNGFDVRLVGADKLEMVCDLVADIASDRPCGFVLDGASHSSLVYSILDLGCFEGDIGTVPLNHLINHRVPHLFSLGGRFPERRHTSKGHHG